MSMQYNPIGGISMKKLFSRRTLAAFAVIGASSLILTACSSSSDDAGGDKVGVSLITKNDTNPFFVAMIAGAKGAVIGRNVWGAKDVAKASRAYYTVIHDGLKAEDALKAAGLPANE